MNPAERVDVVRGVGRGGEVRDELGGHVLDRAACNMM